MSLLHGGPPFKLQETVTGGWEIGQSYEAIAVGRYKRAGPVMITRGVIASFALNLFGLADEQAF